jgi:pimeloyl-ACP methyl ester carboxylesterase
MSQSPTRYARNGNAELAYEDHGGAGGEPLLLVMGSAVSRHWWPPGLIAALIERGFHVASFDNRDAGQSTHFPAEAAHPVTALFRKRVPAYTGEDIADDAVAVMDALGWGSAHLFGHSNGGLRAQRIALRHPHRVRSLVSSAAVSSDAGRMRLLRYIRWGFVAKLARLKFPATREGDIALSMAVSRALASPGYPFDEAEALARIEKDEMSDIRDPQQMGRQLRAHWSGGGLARLRLPVTVMHGEADQLLRTAAARDLAKAIRGARLVIVRGVGHDIPPAMWGYYADEIRATAARARGEPIGALVRIAIASKTLAITDAAPDTVDFLASSRGSSERGACTPQEVGRIDHSGRTIPAAIGHTLASIRPAIEGRTACQPASCGARSPGPGRSCSERSRSPRPPPLMSPSPLEATASRTAARPSWRTSWHCSAWPPGSWRSLADAAASAAATGESAPWSPWGPVWSGSSSPLGRWPSPMAARAPATGSWDPRSRSCWAWSP